MLQIGDRATLVAFIENQDSSIEPDCVLVVSSDHVHCDLVHLHDRSPIRDELSDSAIEEGEIPVNHVSDCVLGLWFRVAFDCLHCVLDHVRIVGPDGGQGNLREPPRSQ